MRNLREEEKGMHPHHITMELDANTRSVLLSSMSGQATQKLLKGLTSSKQLAVAQVCVFECVLHR